jgi:hypothetical protein
MKKSDLIERKFTDSIDISDWEVLSDDGYKDIVSIHKTVPYTIWKINLESGYSLECADDHIVFDEDFNEIFVKELIPGESLVMTKDGPKKVLSVITTNEQEEMYDLTVDSKDHRFYTNGILSHNSTTLAGYLTWYVEFNSHKRASILANKMDIAKEIFSRVQFAVESLPLWLQQGVVEWNKTSFKLENGSVCFAAATSPSAVRGKSINLLLLDEFAHLTPKLSDEFIKSVFPTISSSKESKMVIISTPKGLNHYYKLWNDAENGNNDFITVTGHWSEHPDRDESWAEAQRKELGEVGYQQEVECIGGESKIYIRKDDIISNLTIEDFYNNHLCGSNISGFITNTGYEILTPTGFKYFDGVNRIKKPYMLIITSTKEIRVSSNHQFYYNGELLLASDLSIGDYITNDEQVLEISHSDTEDYLYDPVNVGDDHLYLANSFIHHNCSFIGSSYTLIDGFKLSQLTYKQPIVRSVIENLEIYELPKEGHVYIISVDTSRGRGLDYSAFSIVDVTNMPYEVVVTYKDNTISTLEYPHLIYNFATKYNHAYALIEVNDIGGEISNILWYDYEYENLYFTNSSGEITASKGYPGVRTTKKVKSLGCSVLKELIEKDQLIINCSRIIEELGVFTLKGKSYGADDTIINDDLVASLFLFAWLTKQEEFKEATDIDIREVLTRKKQDYLDAQMLPMGFYSDGLDSVPLEDDLLNVDRDNPYITKELTQEQIMLLS